MKKVLARIAFVAIVVLTIAACAGQQAAPGAPGWYLNPPTGEDVIYGVGSAKMSTLDSSRRVALSRAREDIAFQMNAAIEAMISDYAQEAGVDGSNQVVSFVERVSRQVTETTLQNTRNEEVAQGNDGTIYALVSYSTSDFVAAAGEAFQRDEEAAFAEFKADEAMRRLDAQLDDNPPSAGNVD
ncbi:MAG: LPP20 family lipoprotein [Spirochaetota bacterium]